ncbi:cystatin-like [Candoia aspera]|uniref:cystatin-like n=1 Tax=Candoia aspera TaxID=51853 RepID=UPI002FD7B3FD
MARSPLPCAAPLALLCSLLMLPSALLQVGMPGGISPVPVTDEGVQKAAAFAVEQYNERSQDSTNYFKQLRIVKAQSQVVSGMKYYLTVEMVKTVCEKSSGPMAFNDIQDCGLPPRAEQEKLTCSFQVWSQPWLPKTELLGMSCR